MVDASHCQGCSNQFTFINRKHHCRRCGGLFCNNCTQKRMILRGQGDSPVRICDPCKKLEDAARFELRYGKNRAAKGTSKQVQSLEEEVLHQIIGMDGKQESHTDMISDLLRTASSASSSSLKEESLSLGREGDSLTDTGASSPEELRQQAAEEKKKYRILKGEGKSAEALQAFKRGKELERQAGALEIALRKNRRLASKISNLPTMASNQDKDDLEESSNKKKLPSQKGKEEKNDLAVELRELGWTDADLHDAEKKPVNLSLEGELSNLLGEIPQKSSASRKAGSLDKSQVVALKKKALQLKREGKLAEAKEELKKAKILEKQLEEQELLGEDEESDDELSVLIRTMDDDKHDDLILNNAPIPAINFENILAVDDNLAIDDNFDLTDNDMNDPEIASALKSFGWSDEDDEQSPDHLVEPNPVDWEALQQEVLSLKRAALSQKREGNVAEAMSLLKKAKLLEKDLETMQVDVQTFAPEATSQVSLERSRLQAITEENTTMLQVKSKLAVQKELLALKKKALALRREGRTEEADEELMKGKALEQQLEEMENAPWRPAPKASTKSSEINHTHVGVPGALDLGVDGVDAEVTEQDMHDPAMMSILKNLGWNDDEAEPASTKTSKLRDIPSTVPRRSKAEIQRELLGLKRKALALRRQGKTEEAEEELERAKDLEKQLEDMETSSISKFTAVESHDLGPSAPQDKSDTLREADGDMLSLLMCRKLKDHEFDSKGNNKSRPLSAASTSVPEVTGLDRESFEKPGTQSEEASTKRVSSLPPLVGSAALQRTVERAEIDNSHADKLSPPTAPIQPNSRISAQRNAGGESEAAPKLVSPEKNTADGIDAQKAQVLAHKRKAVALKREGKLAEAREELRRAKLVENSLEGEPEPLQSNAGTTAASSATTLETSLAQESRTNQQQAQKPLSGRDRFKLQQESLAHKRNALKLRREGKIEESEAELELAKALECQLEESGNQGASKMEGTGDTGIEDLLDPQLLSALKSVGWEDGDLGAPPPKKPEAKLNADKGGNPPRGERAHLEEMIKVEKVRALNLKREGKQAEALEALRSAKRLEKKLASLT